MSMSTNNKWVRQERAGQVLGIMEVGGFDRRPRKTELASLYISIDLVLIIYLLII